MIFKVAFDCFDIAVRLSIEVNLDAAEVKVLEIERITTIGPVERFVAHHSDNDSTRYLPCEEPFVNVISHAGTDAITFANDASDWILGISDFERFSLFDKHARRNVNLPH